MSEVTQVIHRHATHIHAYLTRYKRCQVFQSPGQRAVNADGHGEGKGACDKARLAGDCKKTLYYNGLSISILSSVSIFFRNA